MPQNLQPQKSTLGDGASFIRSLIENPRIVGAVSPSGPALAKAMASYVDVADDAPIVELGPGTGPVTEALLARGVAPERLLLIEYEPKFCRLLAERFPGVRIIQGDAYGLKKTLEGKIEGKIGAVVSSLPLLNQPESDRLALLDQAFDLLVPAGVFIQFTYGLLISPMPLKRHPNGAAYSGKGSAPIWLNLPPARVWRYRRAGV
ncbi:MAG: phospholipid methyltransferase [Methylocystaceae bacterium]|nr:MAG: phospholipid methyltransferase [Methylocystaceae bacterium]